MGGAEALLFRLLESLRPWRQAAFPWIESAVLGRLSAMRGPGESYSDVIMRVVEL